MVKLQAANVGCFVENIFVGALAYADDLTLLAPSASAMREMLHICEEYAVEYSIKFDASKSKCIGFNSHRRSFSCGSACPRFFVDNQQIDFVYCWPHLGNILDKDLCDADCILRRREQMIGQINSVLCTFGNLNEEILIELLYISCTSLYGYVLWDLSRPEIQRICAAWRGAVRRVWHVPLNTHNDVVVSLRNKLPLFDVLCSRIFVFHISCLKSNNASVRRICEHATQEMGISAHGRNLLFLADQYKLSDMSCFGNVNAMFETLTLFSNHVFESRGWFNQNFGVIRELLLVRVGRLYLEQSDMSLSDAEVDLIINELCVG
jgi:hypothetical protein